MTVSLHSSYQLPPRSTGLFLNFIQKHLLKTFSKFERHNPWPPKFLSFSAASFKLPYLGPGLSDNSSYTSKWMKNKCNETVINVRKTSVITWEITLKQAPWLYIAHSLRCKRFRFYFLFLRHFCCQKYWTSTNFRRFFPHPASFAVSIIRVMW